MSRDFEHAERLSMYDRFSDWCMRHEEVFGFIRTVCALIGTVAVIMILLKEVF